ncbi:MAG: hypothetical protein WC998_01985 [Candidatus Paceibacterota bacterium]|jgi:hypothetical protein
MVKKKELHIDNPRDIYKELANFLYSYAGSKTGSYFFVVEGKLQKPIIGIRYPGKKVKKREVDSTRANVCPWANLYDFEVVAFKDGKEVKSNEFTFSKILEDYEQNKKGNKDFWKCLEEMYLKNELTREPPKLKGIDSRLFLLMTKWIWIQEDFNYRFGWEDVCSPVKYVLQNRTGTRTSKGAGRAKFFAALILLNYFDYKIVKKIIPLY